MAESLGCLLFVSTAECITKSIFNMRETFYTKIVSVRLPLELLEGLENRRVGSIRKKPLSRLIVQAIDEYLKNHPI